ncbi:MAG: carbohydrate-binding protein [Ignavibacteria bacterium]
MPPATMFCDYENVTNCSQGNTNLQCASSNRAGTVATSRTNGSAIALTTLSGDTNVAGSGSWERCDLSFGLQSSEGTDEWWWSSVYLPDGFHVPTGSDQCYDLGPEFHSVYSGDTQPNFEMSLCPNGWQARVYGGAGTPQTDGPGRTNFTIKDPLGAAVITKNKWYDIMMHTKWSYTSAGITTVYINGTKVIDYYGPNLYQGYNVYLKLPNYHGPYGVSSTLYYDRTVRGPTQAAVAPSTSSTGTVTVPGTTTGSTGSTGSTSGTGTGSTGTTGYAGLPYSGTPIPLPGSFEAENFDLGGQNVAYNDTTSTNTGGQYRTSEAVDIVSSCDSAGGGYVINNFATGEWLNYTVNAAVSGSYAFQLRVANNFSSAKPAFHLEVDGVKVTSSIPVPGTGGWCSFQWAAAPAFNMSAGKHVVRIVSDQQYFNLNSVAVTATATPTTSTYMSSYKGKPYTGTPVAVPGSFMAANYDLGGLNVGYYDTTSVNSGGQYRTGEGVDIVTSCDATPTAGYVVNNFATGEWLNYTINVATAGNYVVQLRASNNYAGNVAFHVEVDGVKVAGPIAVPATGAWCSFQNVSTPAIALTAGTHVLRITSDQQYFNLETVNVTSSP